MTSNSVDPTYAKIEQRVFKFGMASAHLSDYVNLRMWRILRKKLSQHGVDELVLALEEFIKFLILASQTDGLFFTGSKLVDEVWHIFILETREYVDLCRTILPGAYIHHSGITFDEYRSIKTSDDIHSEQLTWLVNYVNQFGDVQEKSLPHLNLAVNLMQRMGWTIEQLNFFAKELYQLPKNELSSDLEEFLEHEVKPVSNESDKSFRVLKKLSQKLLGEILPRYFNRVSDRFVGLTHRDIESIYEASGALGFLSIQHITAIERLASNQIWTAENKDLMDGIINGEILVGLATTHLARKIPTLTATKKGDSYILNGCAPWATGFSIFDHVYLGFFDEESNIVFGMIPFVNDHNKSLSICQNPEMFAMNSTNTVSLSFKNYTLPAASVVSIRNKDSKSGRVIFPFPEIGITRRVLNRLIELNSKVDGNIEETIKEVKIRVDRLSVAASNWNNVSNPDEILLQKDSLMRNVMRLGILLEKGQAIYQDNFINQALRETAVFDMVLQSPSILKAKIEKCKAGVLI